jgi:hypothetical protein
VFISSFVLDLSIIIGSAVPFVGADKPGVIVSTGGIVVPTAGSNLGFP